MLLVIDVGNTNIVLGLLEGEQVRLLGLVQETYVPLHKSAFSKA